VRRGPGQAERGAGEWLALGLRGRAPGPATSQLLAIRACGGSGRGVVRNRAAWPYAAVAGGK
jgi:hypothetical protein